MRRAGPGGGSGGRSRTRSSSWRTNSRSRRRRREPPPRAPIRRRRAQPEQCPTGRARDGEGDGVGGVHDLATVVRRTAVLQLQPPLHLSHIEQHTEHVLERVHLWPLSVLSWVNGTTRNAYAQSPRTSSGRCW